MTVCIGTLCDANDTENTANIILCADTLVTYTVGGSPFTTNINGSKLFPLPLGFYCALCDDLTNSHVFVSHLADDMRKLSADDPALYDRVKLCIESTAEYIRKWRLLEILGRRGITLDEYLHDAALVVRPKIEEELSNPDLPVGLIVGGFKGEQPMLFYNDGINTQEQTTLGFFAAGAGELLATCWLNFREQSLAMSSQRTFYHVLEAKKFAEKNPTVGRRTAILYMTPTSVSMLDLDQSVPTIVAQLRDRFWTRNTILLDKAEEREPIFSVFTPLTSRK
jgi:hypothetical protein